MHTMTLTLFVFALICCVANASPNDIETRAKNEYKRCLNSMRKVRQECSQGCGNILASCYFSQLAVIESATISSLAKLAQGKCAVSLEQVENALSDLETQ